MALRPSTLGRDQPELFGYLEDEPAAAPRPGLTGLGDRIAARPPGPMNSKKWMNYVNQWLQDETAKAGARAGDQGYFGTRMMDADADAESIWKTYHNWMRSHYLPEAEGGPTGGTFSFRDFEGPAEPGDMAAPIPEEYGSWFERMRNSGLTGNTAESDLTRYADPSFYMNLLKGSPYEALLAGGDVASPDFDAQFAKYMEAGNSGLRRALRENLADFESTAAGTGRLRTGFFDEDRGEYGRALAEQERESIGRGAIDVLGLQEQDADSRRRFALDRGRNLLQGLDFSLRAGQTAADAGFRGAEQARLNRGELRDIYTGDRDFARDTFEKDRSFGEDRYRDRRNFARGSYEDDRDFRYGRFLDDREDFYNRRDFGVGLWQDLLAGGQDRSDTWYNRQEDQINRFYDMLAGLSDRSTGLYSAGKDRTANFWNSIIGGAAGIGAAALL